MARYGIILYEESFIKMLNMHSVVRELCVAIFINSNILFQKREGVRVGL